MKCPNCSGGIDINKKSASGKIRCPHCHKIYKVNIKRSSKKKSTIKPPKGAWLKKEVNLIEIGISTKNRQSVVSVILAVFATISSSAVFIYLELYRDFGSYAILQHIWVLVIVMSFWSYATMSNFGQVIFRLTNTKGEMFRGFRGIGITKKFNWRDISEVQEFALDHDDLVSKFFPPAYSVKLIGRYKEVSCKTALMDDQRKFLLKVLNKIFRQVKKSRTDQS